tara:strand:- start:5612 stop:6016 length:405 start_codon:yes stop_codon:yes gene_type:complete
MDNLNNANFMLYAAKHYDNSQCYDIVEFYDDIKRFKYIKRLLNKIKEHNEIKDRLVINHLVVLYNVFGHEPTNRMLFLKLDGLHEYLVPFLIFMERLPEKIMNIGLPNKILLCSDIKPNEGIITVLRKYRWQAQ